MLDIDCNNHAIEADLDRQGFCILSQQFNAQECQALRSLYQRSDLFRKKVIMGRHNFGNGEYQYFNYPLPELITQARSVLYNGLAPIANRWQQKLGLNTTFPRNLNAYLKQCHQAGQCQATPLLLKYEASGYNCLHQDLYGESVFPLQAIVLLSAPEQEFSGGELVLTEQRPRMQSRVTVVPLQQGDVAIIATSVRPQLGQRGYYRLTMRHGVSEIRRGERYTLGIIFHDAK